MLIYHLAIRIVTLVFCGTCMKLECLDCSGDISGTLGDPFLKYRAPRNAKIAIRGEGGAVSKSPFFSL